MRRMSATGIDVDLRDGKGAAKVSCLACRAAKRKCLTPDARTTCRRCAAHELQCEYKKHRRGRTKAATVETSNATQTSMRDIDEISSGTLKRSVEQVDEGSAFVPTSNVRSIADPSLFVYDDDAHRGHVSTETPRQGIDSLEEGDFAGPDLHSRRSKSKIQFSHVVPGEGDSSPFLPTANQLPAQSSTGPSETLDWTNCPDPVTAGLVSEADAFELFECYFRHLNITLAILDPVLHTPSACRERSPLLFAAVITVTSKIVRPKAYSNCLLLANKLLGQSMEYALCSVEIVQAINLLTHWKRADDATSWRRVGYAIRMAQELKLNTKRSKPLPRNERQAREILNRERAWLNLIIADYHLAIHHSLPKMIQDDLVDPAEWLKEHPHVVCPGEALLAPLVEFSRMCRLYADMLAGMSGDASSLRMLEWIEMAWRRWRNTWISDHHEFDFPLQQVSTIKMDDALFRFHIAEFKLLYTSRYRSEGQLLDAARPTPLSFAFAECVDASLGVANCFQVQFVQHQSLPYAFNRVWVALAVTSVWLIKNLAAMRPSDRSRVIRTLTDVQYSTEEASRSSDDMSAYTHRLLKHLLASISPEWQFSSIVSNQNDSSLSYLTATSALTPSGGGQIWTLPSSSEIIQDQLWNPNHPPSRGDTGFGNLIGLSHLSEAQRTGDEPLLSDEGPPRQRTPDLDDLLFPVADDDFWRILFPIADSTIM